ncbi:MAG: BT0820 family HAD-type phosphatase [Bacteroidaceae bacterium]
MNIAVDFDGTIVEHDYPRIGPELPFAIDTLKKLQQEQHRIILWTVREGTLLEEAVEYCRKRGLEFYAVNKDFPEETPQSDRYSRKLKADLFIDDRNLGGMPDWGVVYRMVHDGVSFEEALQDLPVKKRKKNLFIRIGEAIENRSH